MQRSIYLALNASVMYHLIKIVRRDARLDLAGRNIKHLSSQATDLPHSLLLLLVQDSDIVSPDKFLLRSRNAIFRVVGMRDGLRDGSRGRQRVDRSQGAGKLVGGEGIVKTGGWIRFRNYLWREEVGKDITLFMDGLVFALTRELVHSQGNRRNMCALAKQILPNCA